MGTQKKRTDTGRPQRLILRAHVDLVSAYETLREAIVSSDDGAPTPPDAWRLVQEGLLAWGLCHGAARDALWVRDGAQQIATGATGMPAGQASAAVVSLMATLTLESITRSEVTYDR